MISLKISIQIASVMLSSKMTTIFYVCSLRILCFFIVYVFNVVRRVAFVIMSFDDLPPGGAWAASR